MTAYYGPEWEGLASRMVDRWTPSFTGNTGLQLPSTMGRNHGTLRNFSNNGNDAYVASPERLALNFDGTNHTVLFPASSSLTPSAITFSGWFRRPSTWEFAGSCLFWGKPNAAFDGNGFYVELSAGAFSNNTLVVTNGAATSYLRLHQTANTSFPTNTWTHFAFTLARATGQFYLNGLPVSTSVVGTPAITGTNDAKYLYSNSPGYGNYTPGQADDIIIFNSALTPNEVSFIYEQGRGGGMLREPPKRRSFFVPTLPFSVRRRSSRFLAFPG